MQNKDKIHNKIHNNKQLNSPISNLINTHKIRKSNNSFNKDQQKK